MLELSELQKYDKQIYELFMDEVVRVEGNEWWEWCVYRDKNMAGVVVFKDTAQGSDYWWEVADNIKRIIEKANEKV